MGEHMAFASLVASGYPVRLSGEDCGRGTFTHRHAVIHDQNREKWDSGVYLPLQHIREGQANFLVIDSLLSEEAVLGPLARTCNTKGCGGCGVWGVGVCGQRGA